MRICFNTLSMKVGGGVTYMTELIHGLARVDRKNEYLLLGLEDKRSLFLPDDKRFSFFAFPFTARSTPARMIWEQARLPGWLRKMGIDVLFSPGNYGLLFPGCRQVLCIQNSYDALALADSARTRLRWAVLSRLTRSTAKTSQRIVTVSEEMVRMTHRVFGISPENIISIHHGVSAAFHPIPVDEAGPRVSERFKASGEFLLCVSDFYINKNYLNMVRAFSLVREKNPGMSLVIAGRGYDVAVYKAVLALIDELKLTDAVRLIGTVPRDVLNDLYSASRAFVFPSKVESFGLPQIEAMACGAPVVTSNMSAMPEICGDAAAYFNPDDPADMAKAVLSVVENESVRQNLIRKGFERITHFSWDRCAQQYLEVFESVAAK